MNVRIETDSMGEIQVEAKAYWGAQTERSLLNFKIGSETFSPEFIQAYALVKQVAAITNAELGELDKKIAKLIIEAAQEIIDGKHADQFPLKIWQTGSGTQSNMNLNEVISNRAIEIAGGKIGGKSPVHPNNHVNCGQSTNDTFPTAMHVATALTTNNLLFPALDKLIKTLDNKAVKFKHIVKMGRTHLQDATPLTMGQEISSWTMQLKDAKYNLKQALHKIYELAAGATAVGTGLNAHANYSQLFAEKMAHKTKLPFISAPNKFAAIAAHDALAMFSGALSTLACAFMKIANDVRWLASGPRGGLGEISIAENEPGSSIMPGKVNPTQAEAATMVCCQVMGNQTTVVIAASQGNFQLNVYKPVIIYNILQSIRILADSLVSFNDNCAKSIEPNLEKLNEFKDKSLMLVTALAPKIGYDDAAKVAKKAHKENTTLKQAALSLGLVTEAEFDELVKAENMV